MSELQISEAGTVQFPMVAHAAEVGWIPVSPEVARQKRGGESGMLFRDELEAKLARFNPWLSADAVRQVVERLEANPPTIEGNREMLSWLRGERQWYDEVENRHRPIQLVDFETPNENCWMRVNVGVPTTTKRSSPRNAVSDAAPLVRSNLRSVKSVILTCTVCHGVGRYGAGAAPRMGREYS